jgi:hypothetical protein
VIPASVISSIGVVGEKLVYEIVPQVVLAVTIENSDATVGINTSLSLQATNDKLQIEISKRLIFINTKVSKFLVSTIKKEVRF